ncbi:hypothetical protein VTJ49DRAFT_3528 [Mycothermus thermophilus]|uniref:Uncharacterized protein n=1 Tax=Humicola insolens TaxID=85995 RepID=A0ABR3V9A3_HUMIN
MMNSESHPVTTTGGPPPGPVPQQTTTTSDQTPNTHNNPQPTSAHGPALPGRPPGRVGRPQLKQEDLIRIQVLYKDAKWGPTQIARHTGYTFHQVKYALKKGTTTVGVRTGRPRKADLTARSAVAAQTSQAQAQGAQGGQEVTTSGDQLQGQEQQQQQVPPPPGPGESTQGAEGEETWGGKEVGEGMDVEEDHSQFEANQPQPSASQTTREQAGEPEQRLMEVQAALQSGQ